MYSFVQECNYVVFRRNEVARARLHRIRKLDISPNLSHPRSTRPLQHSPETAHYYLPQARQILISRYFVSRVHFLIRTLQFEAEEETQRGMLQLGLLAAGHLPIFFALFFTFMLSASYVLAVWHGDVDPVFPYISYSGDHRPESCVFSMMLNLCSFLIMLIIYLRYSLIVELNRDSDHLLKRLNVFAFVVGMVGGIGMFVVANFQETAVITVHLTGAFLCFGCGCFYMLLQFCLTFYMYPLYNNRRIGFIRGAIALFATLFFVTVISFGVAASVEFHKHFPDLPTPRPWSRKINQPGYNLHCISAIAEWCLAICNVLFILSFSRDFEKLRVELSVQPLVSHLDNSPLWRSATDLSSPY